MNIVWILGIFYGLLCLTAAIRPLRWPCCALLVLADVMITWMLWIVAIIATSFSSETGAPVATDDRTVAFGTVVAVSVYLLMLAIFVALDDFAAKMHIVAWTHVLTLAYLLFLIFGVSNAAPAQRFAVFWLVGVAAPIWVLGSRVWLRRRPDAGLRGAG